MPPYTFYTIVRSRIVPLHQAIAECVEKRQVIVEFCGGFDGPFDTLDLKPGGCHVPQRQDFWPSKIGQSPHDVSADHIRRKMRHHIARVDRLESHIDRNSDLACLFYIVPPAVEGLSERQRS